MNMDTWIVENGLVGFGVVFRDVQEKILACASTFIDGRWELSVCEAIAMDFGLQITLDYVAFGSLLNRIAKVLYITCD